MYEGYSFIGFCTVLIVVFLISIPYTSTALSSLPTVARRDYSPNSIGDLYLPPVTDGETPSDLHKIKVMGRIMAES